MEELSCCDEIVKTLLSVFLDGSYVPLLAELAATSNVGNYIHSTKVVHENEVHEIELWRLWISKTSITIENSWNWFFWLFVHRW